MKIYALLCGLLLFAGLTTTIEAAQFGHSGDHGRNGYDGRDGASGRSFTVVADGRGGSLDARGERGEPGRDGDGGYPASGCHQPCDAYNVFGAAGGDGGRGGAGGHGGDGGNLTVYYDQVDNLRDLYLYAAPGRGGTAGYGGRGADGCRCQVYAWEIDGQTYRCNDGQYGSSGSQGRRGSSGNWGQLKLIPQLNPLPAEAPAVRTTLGAAMATPQHLSQHLWDRRSNPGPLFGRGSELPDQYLHYRSTTNLEVHGTWTATRDLAEFANTGVVFTLNQGQLAMTPSDSVWIDDDTVVDPDGMAHVEISHAIFVDEVRSLAFRGFQGVGRQLAATFEDQSGHPDDIATTYYVKYFTRGVVFKHLRFEGPVPEALITHDGERMTLRLGGLNINSGYLEPGDRINVEVYAKRTSGRQDLTLSYEYNHRIGR